MRLVESDCIQTEDLCGLVLAHCGLISVTLECKVRIFAKVLPLRVVVFDTAPTFD